MSGEDDKDSITIVITDTAGREISRRVEDALAALPPHVRARLEGYLQEGAPHLSTEGLLVVLDYGGNAIVRALQEPPELVPEQRMFLPQGFLEQKPQREEVVFRDTSVIDACCAAMSNARVAVPNRRPSFHDRKWSKDPHAPPSEKDRRITWVQRRWFRGA